MNDSNSARRPARARRRRLLWLTVAAVVLVAAGAGAYQKFKTPDEPSLRTAEVTMGSIEETVTAIGSLQPRDYVDVGAQVSGQLDAVHVEIGDVVERGALLAEIDPTVYATRVRADRAKLADLRAQLAQQRAELDLAKIRDTRSRQLLARKAASADAVDESHANVLIAEAKIASLEAKIEEAESTLEGDEANLGFTKIYAPMAGTVVDQIALAGQTLNANQTAPTIVRVADLETMTVWAQVAEADVVKVAVGMPVYFTTLGQPERRWPAAVRQILPTPEVVNEVVLYNVLIDVDNTDGALMSEMTAQVFFVLGAAEDVPTVPVTALKAGRDGYTVQVLTADGVEDRAVEVGLRSRTVAQVLSGLEVGDRVVVGTGAAGGAARSGGRLGMMRL